MLSLGGKRFILLVPVDILVGRKDPAAGTPPGTL
jgi:hypothetical protein